jgi:hypothetical protein
MALLPNSVMAKAMGITVETTTVELAGSEEKSGMVLDAVAVIDTKVRKKEEGSKGEDRPTAKARTEKPSGLAKKADQGDEEEDDLAPMSVRALWKEMKGENIAARKEMMVMMKGLFGEFKGEMQQAIGEMQEEVVILGKKVDDLDEEIVDVKCDVNTLTKDMADMSVEVAEMKRQMAEMNERKPEEVVWPTTKTGSARDEDEGVWQTQKGKSKGVGKGKEAAKEEEMKRTITIGPFGARDEQAKSEDIIAEINKLIEGVEVESVFAFGKRYADRGAARFKTEEAMWKFMVAGRGNHRHELSDGRLVYVSVAKNSGEDEKMVKAMRKAVRAVMETMVQKASDDGKQQERTREDVRLELQASYKLGILRYGGKTWAQWSEADGVMNWTPDEYDIARVEALYLKLAAARV